MRGYSIIELLVALGISVLLGAFALPLFNQKTSSLLLQQEAGRWLSYLQQVQAKSKSRNENIEVSLTTLLDGSGTTSVAIESTYNASSPLIFYGESAAANPGHIKLIASNRQVKVIISSKGRIRACLSEGSSLPGVAIC